MEPEPRSPPMSQEGARPDLPVDHAHLARYTLGDRALEIEILGLFAAQAPVTLAALHAAQDDGAWRMAAHTLKGSARAVGATRVGTAAVALEALFGGPADERGRALAALDAAVGEACDYVAGLSPTSGAAIAA